MREGEKQMHLEKAVPPAASRFLPARRLATSEARAALSGLVNDLGGHREPSGSLVDNAVEIGPHRKGGAWLVPEVDAHAAVRRIAELEDEVENIALALMLSERLESSEGTTVPAEQVIRELGFDDLLDGLPGDLPG